MEILSFPGSKSGIVEQILDSAPLEALRSADYREPFFGGGSVCFSIASIAPEGGHFCINDKDSNLMNFWLAVRDYPKLLMERIVDFESQVVVNTYESMVVERGISKLKTLKSSEWDSEALIEAVGHYHALMNRHTFEITSTDYSDCLNDVTDDTFIYLDPPLTEACFAHGMNKEDHVQLASQLQSLDCHWVLTCSNEQNLWELYDFASIEPCDDSKQAIITPSLVAS